MDYVVTYEDNEGVVKTIEMRGVGSKFYALFYFQTETGIKFNKIISIHEKGE